MSALRPCNHAAREDRRLTIADQLGFLFHHRAAGGPLLALSGGTRHRPATPELRPGADIENQMSALSDFRRLYHQVRTTERAMPFVSC